MDNDKVIDSYFAAMRRGAAAEDELVAIFDDDAVYEEPFSHLPPAIGIDAIRERFKLGWESPLPEMELDILGVEIDGRNGRATWECRSSALPQPVKGEDHYQIVNGKITKLAVRLIEQP